MLTHYAILKGRQLTMTNNDIKLYDIIRIFGCGGLEIALEHFQEERKEISDPQDAKLCLLDVLWNTELLTKKEYDRVYGLRQPYIILEDDTYVLMEA